MNGRFDLHIIIQPHSEVYCGYFRRLVFGNSFTFSHIPPWFHAKPICLSPVCLSLLEKLQSHMDNVIYEEVLGLMGDVDVSYMLNGLFTN